MKMVSLRELQADTLAELEDIIDSAVEDGYSVFLEHLTKIDGKYVVFAAKRGRQG